jgi:hypothetical protein
MQAQIDSFAAQPTTPAPAADDAAADDAATTAHDDQVMAEAVNTLNGNPDTQKPSEVTAVEVAPPAAPEAAPAPAPAGETKPDDEDDDSDGVTIGHKKIIKPISDGANAKPDINQLAAAEAAAETANEPVPVAPAASEVKPEPEAGEAPEVQEPPADPNAPNPNDIAL